jgi:hypothetical protein
MIRGSIAAVLALSLIFGYTPLLNGIGLLAPDDGAVKAIADKGVVHAASKYDIRDVVLDIKISKWNIKKNPTVSIDFGRFKTAELKTANFDVKIGTATLKRKAKQNMVIDQAAEVTKSTAADGSVLKLICYKGKRIADVYISYSVEVGKKKYNRKYSYKRSFKHNSAATDDSVSGNKVFNLSALVPTDEDSGYYQDTMIFYNKNYANIASGSSITAPNINKNYTLTIINKKQSLTGKLNKNTLPYKKAKSMVGTYSIRCSDTAAKLWTKLGEPYPAKYRYTLQLPLDKAKPGDILTHYKRDTRYVGGGGHTSVYLGGGQALHGSVTYHTTRIGAAEILNPYITKRSYYLWFYNKAAR